MKPVEGYEIVEQTEDRLVLEHRFGEHGRIRVIGNPNPPPDKRQEAINKVAAILRNGESRRLERESVGA